MPKWSRWFGFDEIYEYYGLIDTSYGKNRSKKNLTYLGKTGKPHQDDGFRLRSNPTPGSGDKIALKYSLSEKPCPLHKGDIGCYWLKIEVGDHRFDYIGQCYEPKWGIPKRLTEHFRKICNIPAHSNLSWGTDIRGIAKNTAQFSNLNNFLIKKIEIDPSDPQSNFFSKYLQVKFITLEPSKTVEKKIHRIEGMAMAAFMDNFGFFPALNSRDETVGLDGFFDD